MAEKLPKKRQYFAELASCRLYILDASGLWFDSLWSKRNSSLVSLMFSSLSFTFEMFLMNYKTYAVASVTSIYCNAHNTLFQLAQWG